MEKFPNIKAIEDKEENLYVLRPYWRDKTVDTTTGRIQSTGNTYQAKIKTYEGNDEFSIAQLVNDEFVAYGTKSNTPIFSDSDIKEGYASKEFPLYSMKNSNVHKFILPEGWKGDSLLVKIDKDLSRVVFVYGKKIENIEKVSLPTNVSILLGREKTLKTSASPNDAQISSIEWYSRNEDIATVKDGVVTALKFGETSIYCVVNGNIVSNDCKVTITNSPYYYSGNKNYWTSDPITPLEYDKARQAYVLRIPTSDNFKVIDYELFLEKDDWWLASYGPKTENVLSGPLEWCSALCFVAPDDTKEYEFILYPSTKTYEIKPIETSGINDVLMDVKEKIRIFSIEGLELRMPQKGLNIINGKKIIIK